MAHTRATTGLTGDGTSYYLRIAQPNHIIKPIYSFNDGPRKYEEIYQLITIARMLARDELTNGNNALIKQAA